MISTSRAGASTTEAIASVSYGGTATPLGVGVADEAGCGSVVHKQVSEAALLRSSKSSAEVNHGKREASITIDGEAVNLVSEESTSALVKTTPSPDSHKLLLCRRFKDTEGVSRTFNSLPLFVYATSTTTNATSADGIGLGREVVVLDRENHACHHALCAENANGDNILNCIPFSGAIEPSDGSALHHRPHPMTTTAMLAGAATSVAPASYHLNHQHQLLAHHSPYSNQPYHLHHNSNHQHLHTEQTKSLQELQHEVGALLEFRDLVIETFPDLKHKMASTSSSTSVAPAGGAASSTGSLSGTNTLTGNGLLSGASTSSRREWEPGIGVKRKQAQKEPEEASADVGGASIGATTSAAAPPIVGELTTSLSRSRSNSHSGKKEPKSGENNGSVIQDSGFSTETSSSKEGHSASSTNGALTTGVASNQVASPESDDELMMLLDIIYQKSTHLREEVERLQCYERQTVEQEHVSEGADTALLPELPKSTSADDCSTSTSGLTPKTFHERLEQINKEDIQQLRMERDRLLEKLAEMEAETLTDRIKAAKLSDQVEELINVKKDLEEQLKLAMAQKLELSSRVQQLQQQQQQQLQQQQQQQQLSQQQNKSSSSQSDLSASQRLNVLSSTTNAVSTGSTVSPSDCSPASVASNRGCNGAPNTFPSVAVEQSDPTSTAGAARNFLAFHQSDGSDQNRQLQQPLGRLDGVVSTPGGRNSKCRATDSKRIQAILLETNVIELQRHLLTLTVENQVLAQKLEQSTKSKSQMLKRLDRSRDDLEDLKFQLEEKNIELEGTKAQLRVLESRIRFSTPSTATSFMHSQQDYETNRSSTSTTLMLSRRGDSHFNDSRPSTPASVGNALPAPTTSQISTPSMKAMTHLPMDEVQQHSSSTESAHDMQEEQPQPFNKLMSASVGGISPFAASRQQQTFKKLGQGLLTSSKPSKIPLPGSRTAAAYFAAKPPTGRSYTSGRSPSSANTSTGSHTSNSSSKSSLSRSTGNLLAIKSPNSLKRTDSAQSIRKDVASSLSTSASTSRSSTSSIPMLVTPHTSRTSATSHVTPSPRILQNSPFPKPKRDSLTSRARHLDSLSRVHQQQHQNNNNNNNSNDASSSSRPGSLTAGSPNNNGSYLVASTPKTTNAAPLLNSTVRKELQTSPGSSSQSSQPFLRRATGGNNNRPGGCTASAASTTRRFSSASAVGARIASGRTHAHDAGVQNVSSTSSNSTSSVSSSHTSSEQHGAAAHSADIDSGKVRTLKSTFLGWLKI